MRDGAVSGINFTDNGSSIKNCEVCGAGKMSRLSFPTSESKASKILELIHSDLDWPMETQSIGKAKYFLTFIDDFSRKTIMFFLKYKSEVLEKFKEFKTFVENQTGAKIQHVIVDTRWFSLTSQHGNRAFHLPRNNNITTLKTIKDSLDEEQLLQEGQKRLRDRANNACLRKQKIR